MLKSGGEITSIHLRQDYIRKQYLYFLRMLFCQHQSLGRGSSLKDSILQFLEHLANEFTNKRVIFDNKTKKPTFMISMRAGTGPGVGYQELYQIFVFKSREALEQFMVGDKAGGDLMASTTVGTNAVQVSANPYINVYQLSEKGYALQANYGGAVYLVNPDLN